MKEVELDIDVKNTENIEEETIKIYSEQNPSDFNSLIPQLINQLSIEKQEDEKTETFTNRLLEGVKKVINLDKK
jgi:DNA polymerase sigma